MFIRNTIFIFFIIPSFIYNMNLEQPVDPKNMVHHILANGYPGRITFNKTCIKIEECSLNGTTIRRTTLSNSASAILFPNAYITVLAIHNSLNDAQTQMLIDLFQGNHKDDVPFVISTLKDLNQ